MAHNAEGPTLTKKIHEICSDTSFTQQILSTLPTDARFIIPSIRWCRNTYISFYCTFILSLYLHSLSYLPLSPPPSLFIFLTLLKMKKTISSYVRKFRSDRVRSHIWLRPPHIWLNICAFPHIWLCILSHLNFLIYAENFLSFLTVHHLYLTPFRSKGKIFA
jgi:hypothetical protein